MCQPGRPGPSPGALADPVAVAAMFVETLGERFDLRPERRVSVDAGTATATFGLREGAVCTLIVTTRRNG